MSFGIGTVRVATVIHLTDTLHTSFADRSVISDALRKSLIVRGTEAQFVISWCGLASANRGHRTADWLFRTLCEMDAVSLGPEQIVRNLTEVATAHFRSLRAADKRCEFLLGGWHNSRPFVGIVSNYADMTSSMPTESDKRHHIPSFSEAFVAAAKFQGSVQYFWNPTERHYVVSVIGDCNAKALKGHFRGLKGLMKKRVPGQCIIRACRQIAREACCHSDTIGKNLIGVEMERDGGTYCSYYSEEGIETMLLPDTLSELGSTTQMTISTSLVADQLEMRFRGKIAKRFTSNSV